MKDSTVWLLVFLGLYWAYCIFWGIRALRRAHTANDYFIAGGRLSPWVLALAVTAITFAGWTFIGHPGLVFRDGFQFVNASFYAIAAPLAGVVLLKRQWMLGRRFGYVTSGEMLADYFDHDALRIATVGIALVFGVAFVAILFGGSGFLLSKLTDGAVPRDLAMWGLSAVVLLYCVTGGMQAIAKIAVVQCVLFAVGAVVLGAYALHLVGGFAALNNGLASIAQNLPGLWGFTNGSGGGSFPGYFVIPGVIQFTSGLGVELPAGGPWTAVMCLSFMMAVMGIQASPCMSMMGFASASPRGFAIHQIWGAACAVGIILFVFVTLQGVSAHLLGANAAVNDMGLVTNALLPTLEAHRQNELVVQYIQVIGDPLPWLIGLLAVCAIASLQATGAAFMATTGSILARDVYKRYLHRDADDARQKLVGRLCTGLVFLAALLLATFSMEATVQLGSLAIALSFQLWPSLLAATWFPWITRHAAIVGLIAGIVVVILTDTLGRRITGDSLPWGRWPWTIHSAAWGMFFNVVLCLVVSAMARNDADRVRREQFHTFLRNAGTPNLRRRWSIPIAWIIVVLWFFFAIGPGSILGNVLFGEPNAGYEAWVFGMPSIWAWQIIWWALGVGMIWYLAEKMELSTMPGNDIVAVRTRR